MKRESDKFFGEGIFDWQYGKGGMEAWKTRCFDPEQYWGDFVKPIPADYKFPSWAIRFTKYESNPIFRPDPNGWDCGLHSGGVHNGSVVFHGDKYWYLYRGESPYRKIEAKEISGGISFEVDYICDIGVAVSDDGITFTRCKGRLFREGEDEKYSFEDVCCVRHDGMYYLFCNRWDWTHPLDPKHSGIFLATSRDLLHWQKHGLVFPNAKRIHRNACVLQNPNNDAVRCNGRFVMYINDGLMAYSDDMLHWESREISSKWPGGEGCFALTDYSHEAPDDIILFTGGHHTGHFYAVGEVLLDKKAPESPRDVLLCPVLYAEDRYPWERGCSIEGTPVSDWNDTVFFTGMTRLQDRLAVYYGGSEYYTCLAFSEKLF